MIVQRYPEPFIAPMRAELSRLGFEDLKTPDAVDTAVKQPGTTMIVVNSVCGCAAGKARPGIALALTTGKRPDHLATVFAGADVEATETARGLLRALPAVVAVDRDDEGRQGRLHDGAPRHRRANRRHDRRGVAARRSRRTAESVSSRQPAVETSLTSAVRAASGRLAAARMHFQVRIPSSARSAGSTAIARARRAAARRRDRCGRATRS